MYALLSAGLIVAFVLTVSLTKLISRMAKTHGWVDRPDGKRKLHKQPTPSVGGLAIAIGAIGGLLTVLFVDAFGMVDVPAPSPFFTVGALLMLAVGFYDDTRDMGFKVKFGFQLVAAFLLLHAGYRFDLSWLPFMAADPYLESLYTLPLTIIWIVGIINAVNLIDGLDGLAAGVSLIALACLSLAFALQGNIAALALALPLIGALAGFLVHNFNPASIFMGDSGSLFIGFVLAAYSLQGQAFADPVVAMLIPIVALGLPITDTGMSILRRVINKKSVCAPDRDHIHHRLSKTWPVKKAVLVLYGAALCFGIAAVVLSQAVWPWNLVVLAAAGGLALTGVVLLGYLEPVGIRMPLKKPELRRIDAVPTGPPEPAQAQEPAEPAARGKKRLLRGEIAA